MTEVSYFWFDYENKMKFENILEMETGQLSTYMDYKKDGWENTIVDTYSKEYT